MGGKIDVGVLGATGMVGQQFISRLANHPFFNVSWLAASERSEGKSYADAAPWRLATPMPEAIRQATVEACVPGKGPKIVFSALDAKAADVLEAKFAAAGHVVLSNARTFRMDPLVPLLIPEVNAEHLMLLAEQRQQKGWSGAIVTNPNCATVVLAMALAPMVQFGIRRVLVTTMQAVSGAGYPGVASLDILGNIVPFIGGGEEEKIETETNKILGGNGGRAPLGAVISAQVNRVAVVDGHSMTVSVELASRPSPEAVIDALRDFRGLPQELNLPSAPNPPIVVMTEQNRPQPRLDADLGNGMAVSVGRVRPCPVLTHKFVALGHNTIRGAAGASVLNAELMYKSGTAVIICKFGGTSVADRAAVERLIAIIRAARQAAIQPESSDWRGPVVVVSALGGATDRLLGLAAEAGAGDIDGAIDHVRALRARHVEVAGVITNATERAGVEAFIDAEFSGLERIIGALGVLREVTPRWLDAIAATGEIVSSRIVASALTSHGLAASWVDARKAIVTATEHTAAAPLWPETTKALQRTVDPELVARRIPVIGGFVGATKAGITTTLGRGGSDYTAAIIGACLGASEIQIWTDVDGMLTADPRIIRDVRVVPHLSFAEASELAYFGAKVLHPATIQPAVARNIPVRILNSTRPEDPVGTLITAERPAGSGPLTAVASKKNVTVVDIASTRMLMAHGFLRRIFEVFEQFKTAVDVVTTSEVSVSVTIDDARRVPEIMAALKDVADVTREDNMAVLCAVGDGLRDDPAFVSKLLDAMDGVPVRMLSQAAARRNITMVMAEADLEPALIRVHDRFFAGVPS